ncbi:hypothetical protein FB451DRAFT_1264405, partial [Mycena latifolia]
MGSFYQNTVLSSALVTSKKCSSSSLSSSPSLSNPLPRLCSTLLLSNPTPSAPSTPFHSCSAVTQATPLTILSHLLVLKALPPTTFPLSDKLPFILIPWPVSGINIVTILCFDNGLILYLDRRNCLRIWPGLQWLACHHHLSWDLHHCTSAGKYYFPF